MTRLNELSRATIFFLYTSLVRVPLRSLSPHARTTSQTGHVTKTRRRLRIPSTVIPVLSPGARGYKVFSADFILLFQYSSDKYGAILHYV